MSDIRCQRTGRTGWPGRRGIGFERLEVFQRAYRMSLEVHRASLMFPELEQRALADQVRRASKSVCANLVEGFAKQVQSKAEFRRFIVMAIGPADEMRLWSHYCFDLGYVDEETWRRWRDDYQEITRMLHGLAREAVPSS
jgi:four helix bundle protein